MHVQAASPSEIGRGFPHPALFCCLARAARNAQPNSPARAARLLLLRMRQNDGTEALPENVRTAEIRKSLVGYVMPQTHADARVHTRACARETRVSHQPPLPLSASAESNFRKAGNAERWWAVEGQATRHCTASKPGSRFVLPVGFAETLLQDFAFRPGTQNLHWNQD